MATSWGTYATAGKTFDTSWGGTLKFQGIYSNPVGVGIVDIHGIPRVATIGGLGGSAIISEYGSGTMTGPPAGWPQAAKDAYDIWIDYMNDYDPGGGPPGGGPPPPSQETWYCYRMAVQGPGVGNYEEIFFYTGFAYSTWIGPFQELMGTVSFSVTNVELRSRSGTDNPSTRQIMHIGDQHIGQGWFVTAETETTVTLTYPEWLGRAGGTLSVSGTWGSMPSVGQLPSEWQTTLGISYQITQGSTGSSLNTPYVLIAPTWDDVELNLDKLDDRYKDGSWYHWYSGGTVNPSWPTSGHIWRAFPSGSAITLHRTDTTANPITWSGSSGVPYIFSCNTSVKEFDNSGPTYTNVEIDCGIKDVDGNPIYIGDGDSEEFVFSKHSWYDETSLFNSNIKFNFTDNFVETNEEVEEDTIIGIPFPDLTVSDYTADPRYNLSDVMSIKIANVNVHKPPDVERPTNWDAEDAEITRETDTNLNFTISSTAETPRVFRKYTSRYLIQLERLKPPNSESDYSYKPDWPIFLKANIDPDTGGSIPVEDPLYDELTADEDVTNWGNHPYLRFRVTAPKVTDLTLKIKYRRITFIYDPCYTGWEYRYGPNGEFDYGISPELTATYTTDYEGNLLTTIVGQKTWAIDLRCPEEGDLPRGSLTHVTEIEVTGFGVPVSGSEEWNFGVGAWALYQGPLTLNVGPFIKIARPWDWSSEFSYGHNMYGGIDTVYMPYGYDYEKQERSHLKGVQHRQHNPGSSATSRLDYAKPVSRLADELNWQEGYTSSFNTAAFDAKYTDANSRVFFSAGSAYWWWIHTEGDALLSAPTFAATVRSVDIAAGVKYKFYLRHFLRGKYHGTIKDSSLKFRVRDTADLVIVERAPSSNPNDWEEVGTYGTDRHGRWISDGLLENNYVYRITFSEEDIRTGGKPGNRRYLWISSEIPPEVGNACSSILFMTSSALIHFSDDIAIKQVYSSPPNYYPETKISQRPNKTMPETIINTGSGAKWLSETINMSGRMLLYYIADDEIYAATSNNYGFSWSEEGLNMNADNCFAFMLDNKGAIGLVTNESGTMKFYRSNDGIDFTSISTITDSVDEDAQISAVNLYGLIYVYAFKSNELYCYTSQDGGKSWSEDAVL